MTDGAPMVRGVRGRGVRRKEGVDFHVRPQSLQWLLIFRSW